MYLERALAIGRACLLAAGFVAGAAAQAAPPGDVPFGVYDPGGDFVDDQAVTIEHLFLPWEDVYLPSLNDADTYAQERNRALLVTLEPWTWSRSERNTPQYLRRGIAAGEYDQNMRDICSIMGGLKSSVTLRWGHEMDDPSGQFIWAGWRPADYITAYRRMIDICREEAPNIRVMWSPLGDEKMAGYYPGDEYVDIVGVSVFGLQAWDRAKFGGDRGFTDVFGPRYARAAAFGKPVVVAELGYTGEEAYVTDWENAVRVTRSEYPNLVGVVYFDQREVYPWPENFGLPDWRINNRVIR
jgi:endoglucanase